MLSEVTSHISLFNGICVFASISVVILLIYLAALCARCKKGRDSSAIALTNVQSVSVSYEQTENVVTVAVPDHSAANGRTVLGEYQSDSLQRVQNQRQVDSKPNRRLPEPPPGRPNIPQPPTPVATGQDVPGFSENFTQPTQDNTSELYESVRDDVLISLDFHAKPDPPYAKVQKSFHFNQSRANEHKEVASSSDSPYSKVDPPYTKVKGEVSGEDSAGYTVVREPAADYAVEDLYEAVEDENLPSVPDKSFIVDQSAQSDNESGAGSSMSGYPPGMVPNSILSSDSNSASQNKEGSYFSIGIREPLENLKAREEARRKEEAQKLLERQQSGINQNTIVTDEEHYYTTVSNDYPDNGYSQVECEDQDHQNFNAATSRIERTGSGSASELYAEIDKTSETESNRSSLYAKVNYSQVRSTSVGENPIAVNRLDHLITFDNNSNAFDNNITVPALSAVPASDKAAKEDVSDLYAVVDLKKKARTRAAKQRPISEPNFDRPAHELPNFELPLLDVYTGGARPKIPPNNFLSDRSSSRRDDDPGYESISNEEVFVTNITETKNKGDYNSDSYIDKTGSLTRHVSGALSCSSVSITYIDDDDGDDEKTDQGDDDPNYSKLGEPSLKVVSDAQHSRQSSLNYEESWQRLEKNPEIHHGLVHISSHKPSPNLWKRKEHIYQELDSCELKKSNKKKKREEHSQHMFDWLKRDGGKHRKHHSSSDDDFRECTKF